MKNWATLCSLPAASETYSARPASKPSKNPVLTSALLASLTNTSHWDSLFLPQWCGCSPLIFPYAQCPSETLVQEVNGLNRNPPHCSWFWVWRSLCFIYPHLMLLLPAFSGFCCTLALALRLYKHTVFASEDQYLSFAVWQICLPFYPPWHPQEFCWTGLQPDLRYFWWNSTNPQTLWLWKVNFLKLVTHSRWVFVLNGVLDCQLWTVPFF